MVCLLSLALLSTPARTQTQLGNIFSTITDTTGAVLPGVKVTVSSLDTGLKRDATSVDGQYNIAGLPIGKYTVRLEKKGFVYCRICSLSPSQAHRSEPTLLQ
jgi:hypothetical protein